MRLLLLAIAMLTSTGTLAAWGGFDSDFDTKAKPWHEIQTRLPSFPKMERLLPFQVSPATRNRYFIDPASVSIGEDGVVRFTVVIQAAGGAENVSFEGMRCKAEQSKLYAFGHTDGKWSRNRYARWEPIPMHQSTSYQRVLFKHYFCAMEGRHDRQGLLDNLKQGGRYGE